jgi:excisionase family DNA binding protein
VDDVKLLTPAEAAARFRVHVRTITRWEKEDRIHCIRTPGGVRRYFESEINALQRGEPWELPAEYAQRAA